MLSAKPSAVCAAALFAIAATGANAGLVTLSLANGDGLGGLFNTTAFQIANVSPAGVNLESVSFTVGNTQYLFDQLYAAPQEGFVGGDATQTSLLTQGDRVDDNAGPDSFAYSFSNFVPGVTFKGQWDIDNDNGDFNADARLVMFNNGDLPNAVATFIFSDGSRIDYTFPDLDTADTYFLTIPAPGAGALALTALAGLSRRRRA